MAFGWVQASLTTLVCWPAWRYRAARTFPTAHACVILEGSNSLRGVHNTAVWGLYCCYTFNRSRDCGGCLFPNICGAPITVPFCK